MDVEEIRALRDTDTLHMLPPEALIASIRYLAEQVLELLPFVYQKCPQCGIVVAPDPARCDSLLPDEDGSGSKLGGA